VLKLTSGCRALRDNALDDIVADVNGLLKGHRTLANWSLAQISRNLGIVMHRVIDISASAPYDASSGVNEAQKHQFFESASSLEGIPTLLMLRPTEVLSEREEADGLRRTVAYYKSSPEPVAPHILLGFLTRMEWDQFHCIHAKHHLSFVVPTSTSA
jgi:hypothetical protein